MRKIFLFSFMFFVVTYAQAKPGIRELLLERDLSSPIAKKLLRVITGGFERCFPLDVTKNTNQYAFLNSHWIKSWVFTGDQYNNIAHSFTRREGHHQEFHSFLEEKLRKVESLPLTKYKLPDQEIIEKLIESKRKNFINGHFLRVHGKTLFPKVFVNFHSNEEANKAFSKGRKFYLSWLIPLEQALLCRKLGDYRQSVALLKHFQAYNQASLVVIPQGMEVDFRVGLVAPQSLPDLSFDEKEENYKSLLSLAESDAKDKIIPLLPTDAQSLPIWQFYERKLGGATQFFTVKVEEKEKDNYRIYNIDSIKFPCKITKNGKKISHLLCSNYDEATIDFVEGLKGLKTDKQESLLDETDIRDLKKIINLFSKSSRIKTCDECGYTLP